MREAYTASLNIACGALIGAIIVITTIKLLPNQTPKDGKYPYRKLLQMQLHLQSPLQWLQ